MKSALRSSPLHPRVGFSTRRSWLRMPLCAAAVLPLAAAGTAQATVAWSAPTAGVSIAVDASENVYTASYVQALGAEIVLSKHDAQGNLVWESSFDQTDPTKWEQATWVAVDSRGDVLVSGTLKSGYSNPVNAASLLMKFDGAGALVWRRVYESSFDGSYTRKCIVDGSDNVYVLGLGAGPFGLVTKIKKFSPAGVALWSYFDSAGIGAPSNIKLAPDGNLLVAARGITGSINGYAKVDPAGQELWSLAGVPSLTVGDAAGDASGNTYLVHGEYASNGGTVVKKLDGQGLLLWEGTYPSAGFRIEVGRDQRAVVSGFPDTGTPGAAFFKLDEGGGLLWSNLDADGPLGLLLHAQMLLDRNDDAYLAAGTLFDMAVCKVNRDGTSAWTMTTPGGYATGIALGQRTQSVYVVGGRTARLLQIPALPLSRARRVR